MLPLSWLVCALAAYLFVKILRHFVDNGLYIPVSKKFAIRRYVFPKNPALQACLCDMIKDIARSTLNGELPPYPFMHGEAECLSKRIVCLFYDRQDKSQQPIAVHAPFFVDGCGEHIMHAGLMMVTPTYQRQGIQALAGINLVLHLVFNPKNYAVTEIGASSSYLTIQEKYQRDCYPQWRNPTLLPKPWHLKVARFMLTNCRREFSCSTVAVLNEDSLVVEGYCTAEGGGAVQFVATHASRQSRDQEKMSFINSRLSNNNGDGQFFVGRPIHPLRAVWNAIF